MTREEIRLDLQEMNDMYGVFKKDKNLSIEITGYVLESLIIQQSNLIYQSYIRDNRKYKIKKIINERK